MCFKKKEDEQKNQVTPQMTTAEDTRVRFRNEPNNEKINAIPPQGKGDARTGKWWRGELVSCISKEAVMIPEYEVEIVTNHHIQAISSNKQITQNKGAKPGDKVEIFAGGSEDFPKAVAIEARVGNEKILSLVDSGATISAISKNLWDKYPDWKNRYRIKKAPRLRLSSVNNENLNVLGLV
jgi:hypothetical protein